MPIESATTWPVRSTSIAELIAVMRANERMTWVSLVKSTARISTIGLSWTKSYSRCGAHQERRHDLAAVALLAGPGDDPRLDEVHDRVREHLGVDPEVALVVQAAADGGGDRADARAGASRRRARGRRRSSPIRRSTSPIGPRRPRTAARRPRRRGRCRSTWMKLSPSVRGIARLSCTITVRRRPDRRVHRLDRRAERAEAVGVGRRGVDEHGVERQRARLEQPRHVRQEDRDVVGPALVDRGASVGADEQGPVAEVAGHLGAQVRPRALGVEVDDRDVPSSGARATSASSRTDGTAAAQWT